MSRYPSVLVPVLVTLSLLFPGTVARASQSEATPSASPQAIPAGNCEGVHDYLTARAQILVDRDAALAGAVNPGSLNPASAMAVSTAFTEVSEEIEKLDPPPILEEYHATSIVGFDALANTFAAVSEGGIAGALDEIQAQREPLDAMYAAEETAMAACDDEWVTADDLRATPVG